MSRNENKLIHYGKRCNFVADGEDNPLSILAQVKSFFSGRCRGIFDTGHYLGEGSVYGPMGHEPIPFAKEADAKRFLQDHKGKKNPEIYRYHRRVAPDTR